MKKKILMIQPTPYTVKGTLVKKKRLYFVGLTFPLLAALTPAEWEVEICLETIESIPWETDATVIAIGSMGHAMIRTLDIAREFKKRGKIIIFGGYMVSLMPDEARQYCDSIVIGDAEEVWGQVLDDIENGRLQPTYQKALTQLSYPLPRYDLLLKKKIGDFLPVQAGRGCPHTCSFCSVYCLYRSRYYRRDIAEVLRDIRYIKSLGFNKFLLIDDNILSDREYIKALCQEIKNLGMQWFSQCSINIGKDPELLRLFADSGCLALSFGLESISQESLNTMNKKWAHVDQYGPLLKKIRQAGIDLSTEMVVGADGDTLETIAATAEFIVKNKIVIPRFYILTPIPGTDFFSQMLKTDRIYNHDIYSYDSAAAVHIPKNMTPAQLTKAYWDLYNVVFSIRNILIRTLGHEDFWKKPVVYLFYLSVNLYYRYQIKRKITPNII